MKTAASDSMISRINDILATRITMMVGTIWAFYAFIIFGLTPLMWPEYEEKILYWSNFLQLVFLPIITVGTALLSRASEARAIEDHRTIKKEFALLQDAHAQLGHSLHEIAVGTRQLLVHAERQRDAAPAVVGSEGTPAKVG